MKAEVALVVVNNYASFSAEYLGISRIATYLKQHNVSTSLIYIDVDNKHIDIDKMVEQIPEQSNIIAFTIYYSNAKIIYSVSADLKARNRQIFIGVGSQMATATSQLILDDCPEIDFVMLGDGEIVLHNLVLQFEAENYQFGVSPHVMTRENSTDKYPAVVDIEKMPRISRDFFHTNKKQNFFSARIVGSRGCTARCSFCTMANQDKRTNAVWKGRSVEDIFDEIKEIHQNYGICSFSFVDNSFEDPGKLGKKRILEFCDLCLAYPHKLHFWCYLRAETFTEEDIPLITKMRRAGFTQVFIGMEANNQEDLHLYNKKATVEDNYRAYRLFTSCDIDVVPGYIMFNPYSTTERLKANLAFLKENKFAILRLYYRHLEIYYGTQIYQKVQSDNLLDKGFNYLNPTSYQFRDKDVMAISTFIKTHIVGSKIEKYDGDLQTFMSTLSLIKAILPFKTNEALEELTKYKNELAEEMAYFFSIMYIDNDICRAEQELEYEMEKMETLYIKINREKMKIFKNKEIMNLFLKLKSGV